VEPDLKGRYLYLELTPDGQLIRHDITLKQPVFSILGAYRVNGTTFFAGRSVSKFDELSNSSSSALLTTKKQDFKLVGVSSESGLILETAITQDDAEKQLVSASKTEKPVKFSEAVINQYKGQSLVNDVVLLMYEVTGKKSAMRAFFVYNSKGELLSIAGQPVQGGLNTAQELGGKPTYMKWMVSGAGARLITIDQPFGHLGYIPNVIDFDSAWKPVASWEFGQKNKFILNKEFYSTETDGHLYFFGTNSVKKETYVVKLSK
jgi:hypothetical protein